MAITVIAKNNTANTIILDDLGINLAGSEIRNLTDYFDYVELVESNNLKDQVGAGYITINDGTNDLNINDGLAHINFESEYQDLKQDESISGGVVVDLAVVDVYNNTEFTLNSSWTDINFPNTAIENNSSILEHDSSNNDRILIKDDGVYNITTVFTIRSNSGTRRSYYRIRKNDTTVISQEKYLNTYGNEVQCFSENITVSLSNGDFVSSQVHTDSGSDISILTASLKITKLEGVKGDPGPPGGTTVDVQKNDTTIATNIDTLNFEGGVNVIDEGNNKVTVVNTNSSHEFKYVQLINSAGNINVNSSTSPQAYPFNGQEIRDIDTFDHSTVSNTSRLYVLKSGWYKVAYLLNYDNTNTSRKTIKCQIRINGSNYIEFTTTASYTRNTNDDYACNSLPETLIHLNANDYIELMYNREGSSGTANSYAKQCYLQMTFCRED